MNVILYVEDDPNDVFFLRHAMKKCGLTNPLQVVNDGRQAIDYLRGAGKFSNREQFPFPCLVLLDLKLPLVMGLDVLRWIRAQPGPPPIILVLTASGESSDVAAAYQAGANAFLTKPSEASKLEAMVKAISDFWLTHTTPPEPAAPEYPIQGVVSLIRSTPDQFGREIGKGVRGALEQPVGLPAAPGGIGYCSSAVSSSATFFGGYATPRRRGQEPRITKAHSTDFTALSQIGSKKEPPCRP